MNKLLSPKPLFYTSALFVIISGAVFINTSINYLFPSGYIQNQKAQVNDSSAGQSIVVGYTNFDSLKTINTKDLIQPSDKNAPIFPNGNLEIAIPFVFNVGGKIDSVNISFARSSITSTSTTSRKISLFDDNNGRPGTLLESWNIVPGISPGIIKLNSTTHVSVTQGSKYWLLAHMNPDGTAKDNWYANNLGIMSDILYRNDPTKSFSSMNRLMPAFEVNVSTLAEPPISTQSTLPIPVSNSNIVYVSPTGLDTNNLGTKDSPFATIERAISSLDSYGGGEIVVKGGLYRLTKTINIVPLKNPDPTKQLIIRAADGEEPIFDGSSIASLTPLSGEIGIYLISANYSGTNIPQIWEENAKVRYKNVQSMEILRQSDYGVFPYNINVLAIRSKNGVRPIDGEIRVSAIDYGFQITRSNVQLKGLLFRGFGKSNYSAGIMIGANNNQSVIDNISMTNIFVENSYSGIYTIKGTLIKKVNITGCKIKDVASGINAHGGDVTIEYCDIRNDESSSNLFTFRQPDVYMGGAGINIRDNYGEYGKYRFNVIKGFQYGINLQATANAEKTYSGYGIYTIEHNTISIDPKVTFNGSTFGIIFSRFVPADCSQCGPEKALFVSNIIDGYMLPYSIQKTTSSPVTTATVDKNIIWNNQMNLNSYKSVSPEKGIGENIVSDPMFVSRETGDYRVFSTSPTITISNDGRPAGALSSVQVGSVQPNFRLEIPTIIDKQKQVGNIFEVIVPMITANIYPYGDTNPKNTKITISSGGREIYTNTHSFVAQETVDLSETLDIYDVAFSIQDNGGQWSNVQIVKVNRKSSSLDFSNNYVRANQYGFVVFNKNNQGLNQYISYRKKGDTTWIRGFDDSVYESVANDVKNIAEPSMIVTDVSPNTTYEYMITPRKGNPSPIYEVTTSGQPTTYYVSNSGIDSRNRGSSSAPFKTLQYALDLSLPGDTIKLQPGVYNGASVMIHSGLSGNPISIESDRYGSVVLNGMNTYSTIITLFKTQYVNIKNLSFQAVVANGILCSQCNFVELSYNNFSNNILGSVNSNGNAIYLKDSNNTYIHHNLIASWMYGIRIDKSPKTRIINNTIVATLERAISLELGSLDSEITYNTINFPGNTTMYVIVASGDKERLKIDYNNLGSVISTSYRGTPDQDTYFSKTYPYLWNSREFAWYCPSTTCSETQRYMSFKKWKQDTGFDTHSIFADPLWVDPQKNDFRLKSGSPNILSDGNYIGAFGSGDIIQSPPQTANTLFVDSKVADNNGDGSVSKPFKTIQKAVDVAVPGSRVFVKGGDYSEQVKPKRSGTADKPIIIEGERGQNGERLVTIHGGTEITGWVPAPEIGDGVYKVQNKAFDLIPTLRVIPDAITINGKSIDQFVHNTYMDDEAWKTYFTSDTNFEVTADNPEHSGGGAQYSGKVKFWDVTYAMFKTTNDFTYIRLKDRSDPNKLKVRASYYVPGYGSLNKISFLNLSYITFKGFKMSDYNLALSIEGSDAHHITIDDNAINATHYAIYVVSGHDITLSNNDISFYHYGAPSGAWTGSFIYTGELRYEYDLKQAFYQWYHHWIFNSGRFIGIKINDPGNDIGIYGNIISDGNVAIYIESSANQASRTKIHDNRISNFSSGAIGIYGGLVDAEIYNNIIRNSNFDIRNHGLDHPLFRRLYIYNNWFINPEKIGEAFFFHWFTGSPLPSKAPEAYIYNNNFIGGRDGMSFNFYAKEYGGVPGTFVLNNIFSSLYDIMGVEQPEKNFFGGFDYNWLDNMSSSYVTRNWFGSHNLRRDTKDTKSFFNLNVIPGTPLPSNSPVIGAGLNLSKSQTINGKTFGPLPGFTSCIPNQKFDIGVFHCVESGNSNSDPSPSTLFYTSSPTPTPTPLRATDGLCGTTLNSCATGTFSDVTDTSNQSIWMCLGLNGGPNITCSIPKDPNLSPTPTPLRATDGLCGTTLNSCTQGILRNTEDSTTQYLWMCLGSNNGFDASCSQNRYIPPVTTNPPTNPVTQTQTPRVNQPRTPSTYKPQPTIYKTGTTPNKDTYTINIPTSTIDITLPKPPSWLDVIKTLLNKIITNVIRGVKRTGEVVGI